MNELFKNSSRLLSANVIAQIVGLLVYPILTRIYAPEDFGLLSLFLSIGSILVLVALAEYYYAIVLPKDDCSANALTQLCILLLCGMVCVLVLTVPFASAIANIFKTPQLANYWWLMPIFVGLTGLWNILNYWYIRCSEFKRIGGYQVSQSVLSAGSKIGFGYAGFLQGGLIMSVVIAPLVSTAVSIGLAWKKCLNRLHILPWSVCQQVAHEYRNFPMFTLPRGIINILGAQLPVLLLTPFFGSYEVGLWGMALLLGFTPINMITRALYQSLYQHVNTEIQQRHPIGAFFRKFTIGMSCIFLPLAVGLFFILPGLTGWLLGAEWEQSGHYIRWMLPWLYCSLLTASTCFLADVFAKQKMGLYFEILFAALRAIGIGIGIALHDFEVAVAAYSIGSALAILPQYIWLLSLARKYDASIERD